MSSKRTVIKYAVAQSMDRCTQKLNYCSTDHVVTCINHSFDLVKKTAWFTRPLNHSTTSYTGHANTCTLKCTDLQVEMAAQIV